MKRIYHIVLTVAIATVFAFPVHLQARVEAGNALHIIPMPQSIEKMDGHFLLENDVLFVATGKEAKAIARFFSEKIKASTGYNIGVCGKASSSKTISLSLNKNIRHEEGYTLQVNPQGIRIEAKNGKGLFYGMQTLMQLFPPQIESPVKANVSQWAAPCVKVVDEPRFPYRSIMLDVCRHFMPIEAVKRQIDVLSLFKINNLHFHLTEDQAWRIEIKRYPKLTEIGAWRTEDDGTRHGGYYTQEEIKDLVAYAQARYVNIIPELELPGHELAAIAAYPWLSCRGEKVMQPRTLWGVEDIVMCPGKETTFEFLENVIKELVKLFPSKYFHIGGDESPRVEWEKCPLCQKRIKDLGIQGTPRHPAEAQLQSYVVGRMEKFLNKYGKSIIGWDEILEGGNLNKTATIMSWRGEQGGIAAAKAGHHAIMSPSSHGFYLDFYQDEQKASPIAIGGYNPLDKIYNYDPVPKELVAEGKEDCILGAQGNLWAEYLPDVQTLEYRLYPRALAIAEVDWTRKGKKDFRQFVSALDNDSYLRLQAHGVNFHVPLPQQKGGSSPQVAFTDRIKAEFSSVRPETFVYTTDGTMPTSHSTKYISPIDISENTTLRIATVLPCGLIGGMRTIEYQKQEFSPAAEETMSFQPGLMMHIARGKFFHTSDLSKVTQWETKSIRQFEELRGQRNYVQGDYSAIAEGYLDIPEDGIYKFSTNHNEFWIDGVKLVNNDNCWVKRFSTNDGCRALKKGKHAIRVVFIGNSAGGYPSYWDAGIVTMQNTANSNVITIGVKELFH